MIPDPGAIDVLYVSPHLDDAVFSAGGAIALDARAGRRVAVITAFSRGPGEARRRGDDERALALLGVARIDLALPEAPERDPGHRSAAKLFAPVDAADPDVAPLVVAVGSAIEAIRATEIVGPLGVGRHADHQIAHAACAALARGRVSFYEDLPYGLAPGHTARRLAELCGPSGRPDAPSLRERWALARFWIARPILRERAPAPLLPLAAALAARAALRPAPPPSRPLALVEERRDVSAAIEAKLRAIAAYATEWPRFFPSLGAWRAALAAHARRCGSPFACERRWHVHFANEGESY